MFTIPPKYINGLQQIYICNPESASEDSHIQLLSFSDFSNDYSCFGMWQSEDQSRRLYAWMPKHKEQYCSYCHNNLVAKGTRWRCLLDIPYNQTRVKHLFLLPRKKCKCCHKYATCSYGELKQHNLHMTLNLVAYIQYQLTHSNITPTGLSKLLLLDSKTVLKIAKLQLPDLDNTYSYPLCIDHPDQCTVNGK